MSVGATAETPVSDEIDALVRQDGGRLLSRLIAHLRDFQLAEDSLQDALESALAHWSRNGPPRAPSAWIMRTAQRKAIDRIRRAANFRSKSAELAALIALDNAAPEEPDDDFIADERLKLIFTCCHPALDRRTSVALTLRWVCGLKTEEIARAFVVGADAMAQRLVRARHKIAKAGIPYATPGPEDWPMRMEAVLEVVYLIFNEGYAASSDQAPRADLRDEAIRLCRILASLSAGEPEVEGLLALMLLHHARSAARIDAAGEMASLEDQDRALWDRTLIDEGERRLRDALRRGRPGAYQLQAAVAALHAHAPSFADTDWREIALIYDALITVRPNPVFELNRIVALSYADSPRAAFGRLAAIAAPLEGYQPYHAVRADILARLGEVEHAEQAYDDAIRLSGTAAERNFLALRRGRLRPSPQPPARQARSRST